MMLALDRVDYRLKIGKTSKPIFSDISGMIAKGHHALLFDDPNHRKHVVDLLCGTRSPKHGQVLRAGRTSWAIGRQIVVRGRRRAIDVIDVVCRIYDLDRARTLTFLESVLTHRGILHRRLSEWSADARMELELALALCPEFAVYVTDGNLLRGKGRFRSVWAELFRDRTRDHGLLVAGVHAPSMLQFCKSAIVVRNGTVEFHEDLEAALRDFPPRAADLSISLSQPEADDPDFLL